MKKFIVAAALSLIGFAAQAGEARPAWVCALGFEGEANGVQILVGHFSTVAYGQLACTDLMGGEYRQDVKITIGTEPIALNLAIGSFEFAGAAAEISLFNNHPTDLLGNYVVVQGRAAFALGAGAFTAVRVGLPNIAVNVSVEVMRGLGLQVGINQMRIEALN